jgi:hypothetical protein
MARPEKIRMEVVAAVGVGRAENVLRFRDKFVQVYGTFSATLQLEASIDGNAYFAVGPAVSAPGVLPFPETAEFARVRTTAFTSGAPEATLAGFDERAT